MNNGNFKLELDCLGNAAFQDGNAPEVIAEMLESVAEELREGVKDGYLRDGSNGGAVGLWEFEPPVDLDKKQALEELQSNWNAFNEYAEQGITVEAHGGVNGQGTVVVHTVQDWYDADEIMCEEAFANMKSSSLSESVEDLLADKVDFDDECEY